MKINDLPDISILRKLFSYNKRTGVLRWRWRPQSSFKNKQAWSAWNTKYAGRAVGYVNRGYLRCTLAGRSVFVHRICFTLGSGENLPSGALLDHRKNPTTNNRFHNLRRATPSQNMWNSKGHFRASGLPKNVTLYHPTGRYCAYFRAHRRLIYLGYFPTPEAASEAVRAARITHHGEFARHK